MFQSIHLFVRRLVRATVPREPRLQLRQARRSVADRRSHVRFARRRDVRSAFRHSWASASATVPTYAGQAATAEGKRKNIALFATALDGLVIKPGETFSLWRAVGRPTAARGYRPAAALRNRRLITEVGGSVCLVSTLVYRAALDAGLAVIERRSHSVDSYGERRYFELGLDATVEYAYIDLRLRNDTSDTLRLGVVASPETVEATFTATSARPYRVDLEVRPLPAPAGEIRVATERSFVTGRGEIRREQLGESRYLLPAHEASRPLPVESARFDRSSLPS